MSLYDMTKEIREGIRTLGSQFDFKAPVIKDADFSFALRMMKEGKKYRRKVWDKGFFIFLDEDAVYFKTKFDDNQMFHFYHMDLIK